MKFYLDTVFKVLLLAILLYFPVFGNITTLSIRTWDEARLAVNAYEMYKNGDLIVTHYMGQPDMWNTKPPLLIWIQAAFMGLFGVGELAVRLPSAFAALFTCIALLVFSIKYIKDYWFGFIAVVVLITSQGYVDYHSTRTGDYDALLTLFTTLSGLLFFAYCEAKNIRYLYLFFLFTSLAVLTKSVTGLLFLPAIVLYSILYKEFIPLLKNKHFYFGILLFLFFVFGYYLLREAFNPGYIAAVKENELGGRFLNVIENHQHGFMFYYNNMVDYRYSEWMLFIPCGLLIGLFIKNERMKRLTVFSSLMIILFFLVISSAQTKLQWYDVPFYPFLAILISVFLYFIYTLLMESDFIKKKLSYNIFPYMFLFLIFLYPYKEIIGKTFKPKELSWNVNETNIQYYLKDAIKNKADVNNSYILTEEYIGHLLFYTNILNDKGVNISFKGKEMFQAGDTVIVWQEKMLHELEKRYSYESIKEHKNIQTYIIHGKK